MFFCGFFFLVVDQGEGDLIMTRLWKFMVDDRLVIHGSITEIPLELVDCPIQVETGRSIKSERRILRSEWWSHHKGNTTGGRSSTISISVSAEDVPPRLSVAVKRIV